MFWIEHRFPGRIAIVPRPRGGDWLDREIHSWRRDGFDSIASLLTPDEVVEFDLSLEPEECRRQGIEFHSYPIPDRGVPDHQERFAELAIALVAKLTAGQDVGVHCRQGIGRSSLLVAAVLIAAGIEPEAALRKIAAVRGLAVPETPEQRRWIEEFARTFPASLTR